ncbi:hypothetical protein BS50DRAFT_657390 [Corynespora cassiicola Philippines]|uniref:Uncharacterized protein n=1 Tax=Corynespora cassiicola Philippines TaxID=1448308 RepID=A0A2T2P211_CORCC|nr:hypothetical protein BS50DRAFT_657390 [Corynespora cassiicola Philippines]
MKSSIFRRSGPGATQPTIGEDRSLKRDPCENPKGKSQYRGVDTQKNTEELPPPYNSSPRPAPSEDDSPRRIRRPSKMSNYSKKEQLQRFLVEILAFSLDTDVCLVKEAMESSESSAPCKGSESSILSEDEREYLLSLSQIVGDAHEMFKRNQWNLVPDENRKEISDAVVGPFCDQIQEAYLLDMIYTYAKHQCDPERRKHTLASRYAALIGYFHPSDPNSTSKKTRMPSYMIEQARVKLHETMKSHTWVIDLASPNEKVRMILRRALRDFQKTIGMEETKVGDQASPFLCWPFREGLEGLNKAIRDS